MKLAEALINRKQLKDKIKTIENNLLQEIRVPEDENVEAEVNESMTVLNNTYFELEDINKRIHKTNYETIVDGERLSDIILKRDIIKSKHFSKNGILIRAKTRERYTADDIKYKVTINVLDLKQEVNQLAAKFREFDVKIQQENWKVDLMECG